MAKHIRCVHPSEQQSASPSVPWSVARCTCRGEAEVCPACTPVTYTMALAGAKHRGRGLFPVRLSEVTAP